MESGLSLFRVRVGDDGTTTVTVEGPTRLLMDRIAAIVDPAVRDRVQHELSKAVVVIVDSSQDVVDGTDGVVTHGDRGRLVTDYPGVEELPVEVVMDLAVELRTAFAGHGPGDPVEGTVKRDASGRLHPVPHSDFEPRPLPNCPAPGTNWRWTLVAQRSDVRFFESGERRKPLTQVFGFVVMTLARPRVDPPSGLHEVPLTVDGAYLKIASRKFGGIELRMAEEGPAGGVLTSGTRERTGRGPDFFPARLSVHARLEGTMSKRPDLVVRTREPLSLTADLHSIGHVARDTFECTMSGPFELVDAADPSGAAFVTIRDFAPEAFEMPGRTGS
ncbi:hypothetical protein [Embleya hyalina]|uniref:Uncharacterized protein n=1 Tax=Embleya hyalina TaxID=516124 RepID=A0A401YX38_9ACTN|nr:hypothetical protein [Embleya hyalina]GCD99095.1 hypothetical protein EHYA_06807 [Embleya hyalina]